MFVKEVVVQNQVGLHARPATFFIQKANEFKASVWVEKEDRRVNAKSLLGVLSLGIVGGTTIRIIAADPIFQRLCLADINDLPFFVLHDVDSRLQGQFFYLFSQIFQSWIVQSFVLLPCDGMKKGVPTLLKAADTPVQVYMRLIRSRSFRRLTVIIQRNRTLPVLPDSQQLPSHLRHQR